VRHAAGEGKLIAAWGNGLSVLAEAGVLKGLKVTGEGAQDAARAAGAKYTGRQVEDRSRNMVTALDESAGMRFGQALANAVGI
jgi:putative intracellular protease/amidase